ncbi:sporulation protein YqfD [Acetivibrio clariflavus]|uniref:Sporulation protein YqfD n=1 Tax=Acetivibrio clariflavus (strain DSM 19732 / NBRC 101661 / EBR45) TaxID=720554 RepID=G8M1A5_ACECE|nr:sporulation protein YqfD [Acetivibrio clariflavus]AEV68081.1 sporulation protein YqfD [Acetivibrio clariflavus DSM 19732]
MLLRLWNYVKGYVIIFVEGYFLEKFVNICTRRQIFLWDIKKRKNSSMSMKVSIKGFKMLRPIAKKTGCRVKIIGRRGVPFVLYRYKRRKTFVAGAVLFVLLFYFMTSFVWSIEVTGNEKLETEVIMDKVYQLGVKPGVLKYRINPHDVANSLRFDIKDLSWVSVVIKGTKVKIEVAEGVEKPKLVDKNTPCDIVAAKDGVIKSIIVKAGLEAVKVGETVKKGQVLISGTVPVKNQEDNPRILHAIGDVIARTWYDAREPVETKIFEKNRTGRKKDYLSVVIFSKKIGLFHAGLPYEEYEKVNIEKNLTIGEDLVLPFGIVIERYYENNIIEKEISLDEAKKIAANNAYKKVYSNLPKDAKIVDTSVNFIENEDGRIFAEAIIECLENIGYEREIGGN